MDVIVTHEHKDSRNSGKPTFARSNCCGSRLYVEKILGTKNMMKSGALLLVSLMMANISYAEAGRHVLFTGDFESGQIQKYGSVPDGFFVKTLPHPQGTVEEVVIGKGGAGPDSNLDTRVVSSEVVGSELVKPRSGRFFIRTAICHDKKYDGFGGNSELNKPRTSVIVKNEQMKFDYDVEGYTGFSIYLPKNLENETGKRGEQGKNMLMNISAPGAAEFFTLSYWVPTSAEGGGGDAHWWIRLNHSTRSTDRDRTENIDLGSVVGDKGKWTDFVIRWRSNPFSVDTNPYKAGVPNAKDQLYRGNKGILQVWKAEGSVNSDGNRMMALKVNKVNTPVGLVPHKDWKLGHSFRQYKHGWHLQPTSVAGPVWIGFDEIHFGLVSGDATSYEDVHASRLSCTDGCASGSLASAAPPAAPEEFTIVE